MNIWRSVTKDDFTVKGSGSSFIPGDSLSKIKIEMFSGTVLDKCQHMTEALEPTEPYDKGMKVF